MLFVELDMFSREFVIHLSLVFICLLREVRRSFIPPMQVSNLFDSPCIADRMDSVNSFKVLTSFFKFMTSFCIDRGYVCRRDTAKYQWVCPFRVRHIYRETIQRRVYIESYHAAFWSLVLLCKLQDKY